MHYVILAQSEVTACALRAYLKLVGAKVGDPLVMGEFQSDRFNFLADHLTEELAKGWPTTVIVDSLAPFSLDPLEPYHWNSLIAMLVLAFPEVRWGFGVVEEDGAEKSKWREIRVTHSLQNLVLNDWNPLFDGSGLRDWVRSKARHAATFLPERQQIAAALDEESAYADFHAYTAYRNGFRAFSLTTDAMARSLVNRVRLALTFEDIYLNFPDKKSGVRYSRLDERDLEFPSIASAGRRYFITVGHHFGGHEGRNSLGNTATLSRLRGEDRGGRMLNKPVEGMYGIWSESGLETRLEWLDLADAGRRRVGVGAAYIWPPPAPQEGETFETGGHSAPGRLVQIAEQLIHRAERLVENVRNTQDAVRGAVLATDAHELLGCRTPTLALDALELKHRFEALAECQFGGVEFNLDLEPRFKEIRRDLRSICTWFGPDHRNLSLLNGELAIVSRLATVFRAYNEYDEEDACLERMRTLQTKIWALKQGIRMLWLWPVWLIRLYIEWVIVSPQRLVGVILFWMAALFVGISSQNNWTELEPLATSVTAFFGGEPQTDVSASLREVPNRLMTIMTSVGVVLGFLHLGIFIARLYTLISRK